MATCHFPASFPQQAELLAVAATYRYPASFLQQVKLVVEASCRYKSPARYDDELILETHIVALRRSVLKFGYRVLRDEAGSPRLLADGDTTHVVVDRHLQKIALPEIFATALERFMSGS